jgi:hypothetical protein
VALGEPAAAGLVQKCGVSGTRGQGVAVRLRAGTLILPGIPAIRAPEHPSKLYARHD